MDIKTVWVESVDILVDILGIIQYILKIPECPFWREGREYQVLNPESHMH